MQMCTRSQSKMDFLVWLLDKMHLKTATSVQRFPNPGRRCKRLLGKPTKYIFPGPDSSLMQQTVWRQNPEASWGILMQSAHTPGDGVVESSWQRHLKPSKALWVPQNHPAGQRGQYCGPMLPLPSSAPRKQEDNIVGIVLSLHVKEAYFGWGRLARQEISLF